MKNQKSSNRNSRYAIRAFILIFFLIPVLQLWADDTIRVGPLLTTEWGQRREYARFTPDKERLGCWTTAFGQILYYHRLKPSGSVSYPLDSGRGGVIDENFDSFTFNFDYFTDRIETESSEETISQVGTYLYYTAVSLQKDFITEDYLLNSSKRTDLLVEHFNCDYKYFRSNEYTRREIFEKIIEEIDADHPCLIYLLNKADTTSHAMVIDGYARENGEIFVHINMGWDGDDNGWYNFEEPILNYDDTEYFRLIAVQP